MVSVLHRNTNCSMKPGAAWEFVKRSKGRIAIAVKEAGRGDNSRQVSLYFLGGKVSKTSQNQRQRLTRSAQYAFGIFRMVDDKRRQDWSKPSGKGIGIFFSPGYQPV